MVSVSTLYKRFLSMLTTLSMLFASAGSVHSSKPDFVSGEALAQTPFSCVAETQRSAASADDLALAFNAVYRLFGGVDEEHSLVFRFGNEPTWFEWMAVKTAWCRDETYIRKVKDKIRDFPQTDNGYLWSWGTSTYWPTGDGALHYDGLFRYVAAVAEFLRWSGDLSFLDETDKTTYGTDLAVDASKGRTVYEKCTKAMQYALHALDGKDGLITITEKSACLADGVTRFDVNKSGDYVWNNTGRASSAPSNYWDNLCFGNKDAYETALYYHALHAMRDIELMRGDVKAAAACKVHAAKVKKCFNKTFWNCLTGRYIACIDADRKRWDPGLTFLNVEALAYGLGNAKKARKIFSWLDGRRIVASDSLRGKEIMDYAVFLNRNLGKDTVKGRMPFAPATNTLSIERLSGFGDPWWHSLDGAINIGKENNAFYGSHLENGGYIFYPVYYELAARQRYLGANSVLRRAREIANIYRFNGFDSDIAGWAEGLIGEYPENGIVSRAFISSLAGVTATIDGLTIRPDIPQGIQSLGVDALQYRGIPIVVSVGTNGLTLTADAPLSGILRYYPPAAKPLAAAVTAADGTTHTTVLTTNVSGAIVIDMTAANAVSIVISSPDAADNQLGLDGEYV